MARHDTTNALIIGADLSELQWLSGEDRGAWCKWLCGHVAHLRRSPVIHRIILAIPDTKADQDMLESYGTLLPKDIIVHAGDAHDRTKRFLSACRAFDLDHFLDIPLGESPLPLEDLATMHQQFMAEEADISFHAATSKALSPKIVRASCLADLCSRSPLGPYDAFLTLHEEQYRVCYYSPAVHLQPEYCARTYARAVALFTYYGEGFHGGDVLEIGCGDDPLLPLLFRIKGARRVHAMDAAASWSFPPDLIPGFLSHLLSNDSPLPLSEAERARATTLVQHLEQPDATLSERLRRCGVFFSVGSAEQLDTLADQSMDFVFSNLVFEHVADVPSAIAECYRVLRTGGVSMHRVGCHDHRQVGNRRVKPHAYYAFDNKQWVQYTGEPYVNRWHMERFAEAFQALPWDVEVTDVKTASMDQATYDGLAEEFRACSRDELSVTLFTVTTRKTR